MQEQLLKIYSQSLQKLGSDQFIENMQQHLKQKAQQLSRLQQFFKSEIKEIEIYEKKQIVYKRVIIKVLLTFDHIRKQLKVMRDDWNKVFSWKNQLTETLKNIPILFERQNQQKMVKSRVQVNETQFQKIQMRYRQEIKRQSQMITQLQTVLKNKNFNKTTEYHDKKFIHIKSQNVEILSNRRLSPLKEIKEITNIKERSKSPLKQRTLNKEEVVQKIRKYHQCKTMRENYNASQRKITYQQYIKPSQFPQLPQLIMSYNYQIPVASGFDVLIVDGKQIYRGMWKRGVFQGKGKYYSDHWIYDGQFKNGFIDGFGTLNFKKYKFVGKFQLGKAHGQGTLYYKQKAIYGLWKDHILIKQY